MERKTILVEGMGAPKRVVQQIQTKPKTTTICPLCKKRFKKDDPTVLVDLVTRIRLTPEKNKEPEITVRIQICEPCAQPVIQQKQKVMDDLIKLLAKLAVDDMLKKAEEREAEKKQKHHASTTG
ncbi:MAG: hypothetical protein ACYC9L_03580 [Sulfuricaulis sp.]